MASRKKELTSSCSRKTACMRPLSDAVPKRDRVLEIDTLPEKVLLKKREEGNGSRKTEKAKFEKR